MYRLSRICIFNQTFIFFITIMNFKATDAVKMMKIAFILQHLLIFAKALEIC